MLNIYAQSFKIYGTKQLKGETGKFTIIVGNFNNPFKVIDRTNRKLARSQKTWTTLIN